ncbi:MAG TPA: hypothetical protein VFV23_09555 [Verrucomicrobiae bacterium]|nr:hypothetical protein [Verrucomicrobiae bacterium]
MTLADSELSGVTTTGTEFCAGKAGFFEAHPEIKTAKISSGKTANNLIETVKGAAQRGSIRVFQLFAWIPVHKSAGKEQFRYSPRPPYVR